MRRAGRPLTAAVPSALRAVFVHGCAALVADNDWRPQNRRILRHFPHTVAGTYENHGDAPIEIGTTRKRCGCGAKPA